MNLETTYLGLKLRNPFVVGSAPFCDDQLLAVRLQEAGAAALVMRSLFAEQIDPATIGRKLRRKPAYAGPVPKFPEVADYQLSPDQYLKQVEHLKRSLAIPVIASLNGRDPGDWTEFAPRLEAAGADAIELNCYQVVTDPRIGAAEVEKAIFETMRAVRVAVQIPVAVKISPYHTAPAELAESLEIAGAAGIVVFNRFYQPDVDIKTLEVKSKLPLSDSSELAVRLRWLAVLSPIIRGSLAITGGVHTPDDAIKAILCGADVVQVVSLLIKKGPAAITTLLQGLEAWMKEHHFKSIDQFRSTLDLRNCEDMTAIDRANYVRVLQGWRI